MVSEFLPEFYPFNSRVSCMTITTQQPQCITYLSRVHRVVVTSSSALRLPLTSHGGCCTKIQETCLIRRSARMIYARQHTACVWLRCNMLDHALGAMFQSTRTYRSGSAHTPTWPHIAFTQRYIQYTRSQTRLRMLQARYRALGGSKTPHPDRYSPTC